VLESVLGTNIVHVCILLCVAEQDLDSEVSRTLTCIKLYIVSNLVLLYIAYADVNAMPAVLSCPICPTDVFSSKTNLLHHMTRKHGRLPSAEELVMIDQTCKALLKVKRAVKGALKKKCLTDAEREHCAPSSEGSVKHFKCLPCGDDVSKLDILNHMHLLHGVDKQLIKTWATYKDAGVLRYGGKYKKPKDDSYCIFEQLFHNAGPDADESSNHDDDDDQKRMGEKDIGYGLCQTAEWTTPDEKKDSYWHNSDRMDPEVNQSDWKTSDWKGSDWGRNQSWKDGETERDWEWRSSQQASWGSDTWESGWNYYTSDDRGKRQVRSIMIRLHSK
jgi:hypothetical protein